jgi:hypothetical protein
VVELGVPELRVVELGILELGDLELGDLKLWVLEVGVHYFRIVIEKNSQYKEAPNNTQEEEIALKYLINYPIFGLP